MKKLTKTLQQISLFLFIFLASSVSIKAQYTLTDADVVVTDGIIQSCSYDFSVKDIIIPTTLDGQTVTGIRDGSNYSDGVFYNKGITDISLPNTIISIGDYAFRSNSLTSIDFSTCTSLKIIGEYAFAYNSLSSLDLSSCTSLTDIAEGAFNKNSGLSSIVLPTPAHADFQHWIDTYANTYAAGASVNNLVTFSMQ